MTIADRSLWPAPSGRFLRVLQRHKWSPHEAERRDASNGGGWGRSSAEGTVMVLERRTPQGLIGTLPTRKRKSKQREPFSEMR